MDYALAKQLKDAGFPGLSGLAEPTLTELIEACGERFESLNRHGEGAWGAEGWPTDNTTPLLVVGSTPEEAVAKLWLALNGKAASR